MGTATHDAVVFSRVASSGVLPDDFDMDAFRAQPEIAAIAEHAQATWRTLVDGSVGNDD